MLKYILVMLIAFYCLSSNASSLSDKATESRCRQLSRYAWASTLLMQDGLSVEALNASTDRFAEPLRLVVLEVLKYVKMHVADDAHDVKMNIYVMCKSGTYGSEDEGI